MKIKQAFASIRKHSQAFAHSAYGEKPHRSL